MANERLFWIRVSPMSGSGDADITIKVSANTGRDSRSCGRTENGVAVKGIRISAIGVSSPKYICINQLGLDEFVSIDDITQVDASATTFTVSGRSNSSKLTFSLIGVSTVTAANTNCQMKFTKNTASTSDDGTTYGGKTSKSVKLPANFTVTPSAPFASIPVTNCVSGTALSTDYGATAEYDFSITLTFSAANDAASPEYFILKVDGASSGVSASKTITRVAAGEAILNISTSVYDDLSTLGTTITTSVQSTSDWTVDWDY